ncbi:hypothetical protein PRIPAC_85557 [Pristionchus pacificus]|uniref:Uncharacterized protein n=1 Tax=Pristionchus pacificus TaxID=54126 RepID=A0A2A6BM71_PRIPA|nr:hypothetical protein PRIPAC_85557 [Pristionchus pacificus]|eukprot:PDM67010.1 hypothetical protein PRIPAC_48427 [Pristionchus pacificus]
MKVRRPLPRKTEANQHRAFEKMINKSKERTKAHLADLREANNKLTEIAKPKKDYNVVGRPSEKPELANLLRDKRAERRATRKHFAEIHERLKASNRRIQQLRQAMAALRAARMNALMAAMPAPAA